MAHTTPRGVSGYFPSIMATLCAVQLTCTPGDVVANTERLDQLLRDMPPAVDGLTVLPELCDTGYTFDAIRRSGQAWPNRTLDLCSALASRLHVAVAGGVSERTQTDLYNAMAIFDCDGTLADSYRKTHLFRFDDIDERTVFTAGAKPVVATVCGTMRVGALICFDIRFPEFCRSLAVGGATILAIAAAWPASRIEHWRTLVCARAIENQCFVVAANRVGTDGRVLLGGHSMIVDPMGHVLGECGGEGDEVLRVDVDLEQVASVRRRLPCLELRRPELYD